MSLFRGSGRLEQKLAQNNDPMKQKRIFRTGSQFTVFACVLLGCAAFVFVDGLVTKNRK